MELLLTAFAGTSSEVLLEGTNHRLLLLPSDKQADGELLKQELDAGRYDLILSFGQKPSIRDKVVLETTARKEGAARRTRMNVEGIQELMRKQGLTVQISDRAGTSFCNELYWRGLTLLEGREPTVEMIFLHVPFLSHITNRKEFQGQLFRGIREIGEGALGGI